MRSKKLVALHGKVRARGGGCCGRGGGWIIALGGNIYFQVNTNNEKRLAAGDGGFAAGLIWIVRQSDLKSPGTEREKLVYTYEEFSCESQTA